MRREARAQQFSGEALSAKGALAGTLGVGACTREPRSRVGGASRAGRAAASPPPAAPRFLSARGGGEIARILEESGCGFTVAPGDGEALTERILALAGDRDLCASMGGRARMAFERQWHKERALAQWEALLQAVGHMPL